MQGDSIEANLTPVGRVFSAASTLICVPISFAENGTALGTRAGEARLAGGLLDRRNRPLPPGY